MSEVAAERASANKRKRPDAASSSPTRKAARLDVFPSFAEIDETGRLDFGAVRRQAAARVIKSTISSVQVSLSFCIDWY